MKHGYAPKPFSVGVTSQAQKKTKDFPRSSTQDSACTGRFEPATIRLNQALATAYNLSQDGAAVTKLT